MSRYSAAPAVEGGGPPGWIPLSPVVSEMLEQSRILGEPQTVLEMDGEVYEVIKSFVYIYYANIVYIL
jgi:hypothetical protein